jgi:large subunit ribosomal protein L24
MKIKRDDQVVVIQGRDKGKSGKVLAVMPQENKLLVEGINVVKKHTKPSNKIPRGGILDVTKPINTSKVMVLDPASGLPARVGYSVKPDGSKERVFKVSSNYKGKTKATPVRKTTETGEKAGQK